MDVQMPEMDGLEATGKIRSWEQTTGKHVPIIAMTAYAMKGDRERFLAAGMDGYLSKPIRPAQLLASIEAVLPPPPVVRGEVGPRADSVIDWTAALEHVGGDRELLHDLIGVFVKECPAWLADLRLAVACSDSVRIKEASHKIKGALGHLGGQTAYQLALRLETSARKGSFDGVAEAMTNLEAELDQVLSELARQGRGNDG